MQLASLSGVASFAGGWHLRVFFIRIVLTANREEKAYPDPQQGVGINLETK